MAYLDLRLIPEYDGEAGSSVMEWLEKVELICKLRGVSDGLHEIIPLKGLSHLEKSRLISPCGSGGCSLAL